MAGERLLVAVPHPLLREGIRCALRGGGVEVVGEAPDAARAAASAGALRPDACLIDLDLPGGGIPAVRGILRQTPGATVVMLADSYGQPDVVAAFRAGVAGFLDKDIEGASLATAIRAAIAGEALVPRRLVSILVREVCEQVAVSTGTTDLTRRESEVLELMREGLSTTGIAERLFVSPGTVRSHVMALMHKFEVGDRESLLRRAATASWPSPALAR